MHCTFAAVSFRRMVALEWVREVAVRCSERCNRVACGCCMPHACRSVMLRHLQWWPPAVCMCTEVAYAMSDIEKLLFQYESMALRLALAKLNLPEIKQRAHQISFLFCEGRPKSGLSGKCFYAARCTCQLQSRLLTALRRQKCCLLDQGHPEAWRWNWWQVAGSG